MPTHAQADPDELRRMRERGEFLWLDLRDPDPGALDSAAGVLGIPELALEDTKEPGQRPRLDAHAGQLLRFDAVRKARSGRPPGSEPIPVHRVIDALTGVLLDVLVDVVARVETCEREIFRRHRPRDLKAMAQLRRHLGRALDETEAARDSVQGMLDTSSNEVQERLTIVATIFLPLTALTGFFGMNFHLMISHIGAAWAFFGLGLGGLFISAALIMFRLLRSGLYNRPER